MDFEHGYVSSISLFYIETLATASLYKRNISYVGPKNLFPQKLESANGVLLHQRHVGFCGGKVNCQGGLIFTQNLFFGGSGKWLRSMH